MIIVKDPKASIWEVNPHLEIISEFKKFKEELGVRKSSKILTAIYLIYDPKSELRNSGMTDKEVYEDVTNNYLAYKDFSWPDYDHIKVFYLDKCITKTEKLFLRVEQDLDELNTLMGTYKYDRDNALERTKLTKEYKSLLLDYIELKNKVQEEKQNTNQNRGDYEDSLIESLGQG